MTTTSHRRQLGTLALGFLASVVVYSGALGPYLTYPGEPTSARILTLFALPITATVIHLLIRSLRAPRAGTPQDAAADHAIDHIVLCVVLFLMSVHAILLAVLLGAAWIQPIASRAVVVLVGFTLIAVGNLLPRTRPNLALGIRTSRTLTDRRLWMLTHRVGGYIAVAVGALSVLSGLFLAGPNVAALPGTAFLIGLGVLFACYWKFTHVPSGATRI
jgi:immunity protein, SdpI family